MTKEEIEVEAKAIDTSLRIQGFGRIDSESLVASIVALCGKVADAQRDAEEATVAWHFGCGGKDHGHPGINCIGQAVNSIRAGGIRK